MDFRLTKEQKMVRDMTKDFVDKEIIPYAGEWEKNFEVPTSVVKKMAGLGMMGATIPSEYGGASMDYVSYHLMIEELGCGSSSLRATVSVQNSLTESTLYKFGTESQKRAHLVLLAKGEKIGAWALTEAQAGSDAANLQTSARLEGDEYVLNGTKMWITNGDIADVVIIFATTDKSKKQDGIAAFIVEKGTAGFKPGGVEIGTKLGLRSSHTAELVLEDCHIPKDNIIAGENKGWDVAMHALTHGRLSVAAGAVGIARACLEESVKYSKQRMAFGRPISSFQMIKDMIAQMATEIDASRLLYLRAAQMNDLGIDNALEASMAKLFNAQMVMRAADSAIQIHGAYGYSSEYPVERHFRDARICGIYEGTNEIQKLIIAREILNRSEA